MNATGGKLSIGAGGYGMNGRKGVEIPSALSAHRGGEVGATRAAVEAGWIGSEHQVGQAGKNVKPDLYVACGISGSIQHMAGISQSKYIISIIGDVFQIVPLLTERIGEPTRLESGQ